MEADTSSETILAPLREAVKIQGDLVRSLKASSAPELDVKRAVAELKTRKKKLEDKELSLRPAQDKFDRAKMEDTLKRRFFYDQSFAIYGGVTGQFDFGPMGCAMKANLLAAWRKFFVLEEQMLEVDCTVLTPEPVLKASGHVERFADLMVKDLKNGECFRLDHLIKSHLEKIISEKKTDNETKDECNDIIVKLDGMNGEEMAKVMKKFSIKSPVTGNDLTDPIEFNLMFQTNIGPTGTIKGFLRPETAQGIFVNFKRLLEFNQGKLPFAAAQIGNSFRNEISPRSGLIRVREFTMAEIEHFCDPKNKNHPKFHKLRNTELLLYSACAQMEGRPATTMTIGDAVDGPQYLHQNHFRDLDCQPALNDLNSYLSSRSYIENYEASDSDKVVLDIITERFSQGELEKFDHVARWLHHINTYQFLPGPKKSLQEITDRLFNTSNVQKGPVANQTLGYFMARIQQFLFKMGVDPARLRFRQHMNNEMAHYACDCWDAELLTSYGWVECVGCADRSAYDLTQHTKATNVKLCAVKQLEKSMTKDVIEVVPNKQPIGKGFKKDAKLVIDGLSTMEEVDISQMETNFKNEGKHTFSVDNRSFTISPAMVSVKKYQKKVDVEDLIPAVIEPSFGIGRIMYSILEHNFKVREGDEQRTYFSLPPIIAPVKCSVLPLSSNPDFTELVENISRDLRENDISHRVDDSSGSIGKRYARTDEVAIPFGITVDFDSLKIPNTATLRERDSTLQVRIPVDDIGEVVRSLSLGKMSWCEALDKFPRFQQQENKN